MKLLLNRSPHAPARSTRAARMAREQPDRANAEAAADPAATGAAPDDRTPACGWFDSSLDLQQGLLVQEHVSLDSLAQELPLAAWLDWHLALSSGPQRLASEHRP